jgi:hypothetical protein
MVAFLAAGLLVYFHYFFKEKRNKATVYLALLRFLSIFSILFLLINPKIEKKELTVVKPKLLVAIDNSSSIRFSENENTIKSSKQAFENHKILNEKFDLNYFTFGNRVEADSKLSFDQNQTNIKQALQDLNAIDESGNAPIILMTDGNQTYGSNYKFYPSKQAIYPLIIGDTVQFSDLEISQINANEYSYLENKFPVEAFIRYSGKENVTTDFTVKEGNSILFQQKVAFTEEDNLVKVQFYLTADKIGKHLYQATISALAEEKNTLNNVKNFSIEVMDEQTKIAIVYDVLHPDIGMFKKSIEINTQRKVILLDINSTIENWNENDIFIFYQPNQKFKTYFESAQNSAKNYFIITGSATDWNFLNTAQNIVTKNILTEQQEYLPQFQSDFTAFPITDIGFSNFSPLEDSFGEIKIKVPFESILTQNINGIATEYPLLISFSDGNQRGIALFGENIWKWRALSYASEKSFESFDNFVNSLMQFLTITTKTNQIDLTYNAIAYSDEPVRITAKTYDSNLNFDESATLELLLENEKTGVPFLLNGNTFEVNLDNLEPGSYSFKVKNIQNNAIVNGKFTVVAFAIEQQALQANSVDLQFLAESSNGQAFYPNQIDQLIDNLANDSNFVSIQKESKQTVSLIDWEWLLGLIVLSLFSEWFLRKYKGFS